MIGGDHQHKGSWQMVTEPETSYCQGYSFGNFELYPLPGEKL
ncbi:hypothetical protein SESI111939_17805 [Serratia silvae]